MKAAGVLLLAATLPAVGQTSPDLSALVDGQLPSLVATYENLHKHPELSHYEVQTSAFLAAELSKSGFEVTQHVGTYPDGSRAHGVVAPPITTTRLPMVNR